MKFVDNKVNKSVEYLSNGHLPSRRDVWMEPDAGSKETGDLQCATDRGGDGEWILKPPICKKGVLNGAEVWASREHDSGRITVKIKATDVLDLRAVHLIRSIDEFVRNYKATRIIIDLGRTYRIQDSGLAMLLLLKKKLKQQINKIKLINTGHLDQRRLCYLSENFEIHQ